MTDVIQPSPTMPPDELSLLVVRARTDRKAADLLVRTMVRYVEVFVRHFAPSGDDDLLAAGLAGLWRAVEDYRPDEGSFPTYAAWWIKRYIREEKRKAAVVAVTRHGIDLGHRRPGAVSIHEPLGKAGSDTLTDSLPDDDTVDQILRVVSLEERAIVQRAISGLSERAQKIIRGRMEEKTLQEIGDELGMTREGVRQHEAKALAKLTIILREALA